MADDKIDKSSVSRSDDQPVGVNIPDSSGKTPPACPKLKRFPGWYLFLILYGGYALFILMPLVGVVFHSEMYSSDLYSVKKDLFDYFEKHEQFPPAEKWCDAILEQEGDIWPYLEAYEQDKDSYPCILNKHIFEHKELPGNMVVAFSGGEEHELEASGWNQVGDIERAKNYDRVAVLFGNGEMYTFRKKLVPYLRWRFEGSGVMPKPYLEIPFLVMTALLTIVFMAIVITCRNCLRIFWRPALGIGAASAISGGYLGGLAVRLFYLSNFNGYQLNHSDYLLIPWVGSIVGFAIGICFVVVLGAIYKKYHANVNIASYAIVLGPLTGITASSIIHGYLMIAYGETGFMYMMAGTFFGIIAGGVLGLITSGLLCISNNKSFIQNERSNMINSNSGGGL